MINRRFFKSLKNKKVLHKKGKRWLIVSTALLGLVAFNAASAGISHADALNRADDAGQQTDAQSKPVNITHGVNADAQQGYGDVDNDSAEMKQDLNYKATSADSSAGSCTELQSASLSYNSPEASSGPSVVQSSLKYTRASSNSNSTDANAQGADIQSQQSKGVSNVSSIQRAADYLHAHLLNHVNVQKQDVKDDFDDPFNDGMLPITPFHSDSDVLPSFTGIKDVSSVPGVHAYLSSDGTLLDVKGDFSNYKISPSDKFYGLDGNDNRLFKNVTILELSDSSNLKDACNLFRGMSDLVQIYKTGDWDPNDISDMSGMFESDANLSDISPLRSWNTSHVKSMRGTFSGDSALVDLSPLSGWDTSHTSDMNSMFLGNTALKTLSSLQNWDVSHVSNLADMFFNDSGIYDLSPLYNWNTGNVHDMSGTFFNLNKVKDLTPLTEWDTHNVDDMSYLFSGDTKIANLKPLADWNIGNVSDLTGTFMENSDVSDFTPLSKWNTGKVKSLREMLASDQINNLSPLSSWNVANVSDMSQMLANDYSVASLAPLKDWNTSNVSDLANMFQNTMVSDVSPLAGWQTSRVNNLSGLLDDTDVTDWSPISDNWSFSQSPKLKDMLNSGAPSIHQYPDGSWGFSNTEPQGHHAILSYTYNGKQINRQVIESSQNRTYIVQNHAEGLPKGYVLTDPTQRYSLNGQTYNIAVEPLRIKDQQSSLAQLLGSNNLDTINYVYNSETVGTSQLIGQKGTSFTLGSNPNNLSSQYRVTNPGISINYDGSTHNVPVELNEAAPVTMSLVNQAGATVGFVTLKDLGLVGQRVNIAPRVSQMMPMGYSLPSDQPIYITLTDGSSIVINA